jgi:hypothetical protein
MTPCTHADMSGQKGLRMAVAGGMTQRIDQQMVDGTAILVAHPAGSSTSHARAYQIRKLDVINLLHIAKPMLCVLGIVVSAYGV